MVFCVFQIIHILLSVCIAQYLFITVTSFEQMHCNIKKRVRDNGAELYENIIYSSVLLFTLATAMLLYITINSWLWPVYRIYIHNKHTLAVNERVSFSVNERTNFIIISVFYLRFKSMVINKSIVNSWQRMHCRLIQLIKRKVSLDLTPVILHRSLYCTSVIEATWNAC